MRTFTPFTSKQSHAQHETPWRIAAIITVAAITLAATTAGAHGAPVIDGLYTGDWCAPANVGVFGPDSLTTLTPPLCGLGSEIFWDDWDATTYGGPPPGVSDTMGWLVGGAPGTPLTDYEVDINFFATTADPAMVYFTVMLGPFPSTGGGVPPNVQIAIDVDGPASGNPFWYDPIGVTLPVGLASLPGGIFADFLVTTDGPVSAALVWEATSVPGVWTQIGVFPLAWSGNTAPPGTPSIFEIAIPWPTFNPSPPGFAFTLGAPAQMTVMAAHGIGILGAADAPMTGSDDVLSESGAGFTFSPDICPPGPPSTDCEINFPPPIPGAGVGTSDAYISVLYPAADLVITKTDGVTTVNPGNPVTYTITASNPAGPSTATGATVGDVFPTSLTGCTWTCAGAGGGVCAANGTGNINDIVTLPTGGAVTYTANCILSPTASGSLVNTATIMAPIGIIDPNPTNDNATDTDTIIGLDFGDAPDPTYPTLLAGNGARHAIVGPFLGASVDGEIDGQPSPLADGDDLDGNDDEDGVVFTSAVVAGQSATATITTTGPGLLDAWVDFNADGDWNDPGEQIFAGYSLAAGPNGLSFSPPAAASAGVTFARFRFSQTGGLSPTGAALDGEVEDELVTITRQSDLAMTKTDSMDPVYSLDTLQYTLRTTNLGPSDASGITVTDTLPASTTFVSAVPGSPTCTHSSGTVTCNLPPLAAGAHTDVVLTVVVNVGTSGDITNSATVSAVETDPVAGNNTDTEITTVRPGIFSDDFETGDTSAWTSNVPKHTLVSRRLDGRLDEIWTTFRLDPEVLQHLQPTPATLVEGVDGDGTAIFRLEIRGGPNNPSIRAQVRLDDDSWANTDWQTAEPLAGWINMSWRRALVDLNDGSLEIRHDGSLLVELQGLDNDRWSVDALAWAEVDGQPVFEAVTHR